MTHAQAVKTSAVERYLLGEMPELERYAFEEHYFSCLECAEDVRTAGLMRDGAKAGLIDQGARPAASPAVDASATRAWRPSVVLPWAVAATLAITVGYQTYRVPQPRFEAQALSPITLRPASRGAEPVVPLAPGASAVTLAVELTSAEPGELVFELRTSGTAAVSSGRVQPPPPGAPLMLLIPVWTLTPGEHYILTVRHAASGSPAGEFRFEATR
jgi:anti-sigma factor RsiW